MRHRSLWGLTLLALCCSCGMAERDDEDRKSYDYLTFYDEAFEQYCLEEFDTNHDDRLSRYEAESVRHINCPSRGITSLDNLDAFIRLESLDCSNNHIDAIDAEKNLELRIIRCGENRLTELKVGHLRRLTELACHANRLPALDLSYNSSLQWLDCRSNLLTTLDLSPCSVTLRADTRSNPSLTTLYYRAGQQINYDAPTVAVER